jgi:hypothetical protein
VVAIEEAVIFTTTTPKTTSTSTTTSNYNRHRSTLVTIPYLTLLEHLSFPFNNDSSATLSLRTTRDYRATKSPFNQPNHGHGHTTSQRSSSSYQTKRPTANTAGMDDPSTPSPTTQPYTTAILLATFSLLSALLITPPMLWHFSNRNIGATSLILWLLLLNSQAALNALLWPHDDLSAYFNGTVVCDIEVKLQIAASVGVPSSVASILRALARVMNTEKASLGLSKGEKRRGYVIDLVWCVGCPVLQMFFHYVVQTERYYVVGIAGCTPAVSNSWVTDLLIFAPPVGWTVFGGFYSGELIWIPFLPCLLSRDLVG